MPYSATRLDLAAFVKIDGDHALIGDFGLHEGDGAVGLLRDVVKRFAADRGYRRRRAEHEQHLFLRGAERDLLERAVGQHIAALEGFTGAARERERQHQPAQAVSAAGFGYARKYPTSSSLTCLNPLRAVPAMLKIGNRPPSSRLSRRRINLMIWRLFRTHSRDRSIDDLYGMIVAQARSPAFYSAYGVPDTMQGRFDLIVLHLVLLLERLGGGADAGRGIGQRLFDAFCRDLDANLREMGVGDLAVPKRMRAFGEAFYGRQAAYVAAFAAADERELEKALTRNIFPGADDDSRARCGLPVMRAPRGANLKGRRTRRCCGATSPFHNLNRSLKPSIMPKVNAEKSPAAPWQVAVAVDDIAETGQHFDLIADAAVRAAVAQIAGLRDLSRLEARFDVSRRGAEGLHVAGVVSATVGQNCVVTLEPLTNEVEEAVDLVFVPQQLQRRAPPRRRGRKAGPKRT